VIEATGLSHVYYPSTDREQSLRFLTQTFGFYEQRRGRAIYAGCGDVLVEILDAAGVAGEYVDAVQALTEAALTPAGSVERPSVYAFGIAVLNMDAAIGELRALGIEIVREPWEARTFWGRQAIIKDPVGQQIALREWRSPDSPHFLGWHPE
jgi:predicted enzyme related to lactoylglutathione lyase